MRKLVDVPKLPNTSGMSVVTVNADETLIAGTYIEGEHTDQLYGQNGAAAAALAAARRGGGAAGAGAPAAAPAQPAPAPGSQTADNRVGSAVQGPHYQPPNKGEMMAARLAARLPLVLFTAAAGAGPARGKGWSHQAPAALHRLGESFAVFADRSGPADVLPRRQLVGRRPLCG